jgi:hypothetical protein
MKRLLGTAVGVARRSVLHLLAALSLCGCGGGGGTVFAAPVTATPASWVATLRANPTAVRASMTNPLQQYMYIDSGATNGVYPSPSAFAANVQAANPGFPDGACSQIARMSASVVQFTDANGVQAPSYVVFFTPRALGTCTQQLHLGAAGTQSFSVTVES